MLKFTVTVDKELDKKIRERGKIALLALKREALFRKEEAGVKIFNDDPELLECLHLEIEKRLLELED